MDYREGIQENASVSNEEEVEVIQLATEDYVIISDIPGEPTARAVSSAPVVKINTSVPAEPIDPYLGKVILGRYEIQSLIGVGGMGRVYRAYQNTVDRFVAIKILPNAPGMDGQIAQRFHMEARAASRLSHPNTITVHDFGQLQDGSLCIVMEFLTGQTLEYVITEKPNVARVLRIVLQICGSLAEAHQHGIIHRDLKPPNIIVSAIGDDKDWVKVVDFGIAKLLDTSMSLSVAGTVSGTPEYMSPEQVQGEPVDARSDIYSLGLLLYELLTGKPVVQCNTPMACMYAHIHNTPAPFSKVKTNHPVTAGMEAMVMKMLSKNPKERFQSISELMPVLSEFLLQEVTKRKSNPPLNAGSLSTLPPRSITSSVTLPNRSKTPPSPTSELQILRNLAEFYEERGEPEQATEAYRKIACIFMDDNEYREATKVLMSALALCPNDDASRRMIETCFAILDKKKMSESPAGAGLSSVPPPHVDVSAPSITAETGKKMLAARLENAVTTDNVREALSIIRTTLAEDPTNVIAIEYAGHIYENVEDNVLDQDEEIWLKALLGKTAGKSSKKPSFVASETNQDDGLHLVEIAGGTLASIYGGTYEVAPFEIQMYPVTNAEYKAFIQATGELPPSHWLGNEPPKSALPDAPVVGVTLMDARKYAEWCGMRLPTTVEWEAAVRLPDGRMFPWGNEWNSDYCHCSDSGASEPGPVGKHKAGASHCGCLDLLGNVWEWTENHEGVKPPEPGYFWVMGGSFRHPCVKDGKVARTGVSEMGAYPYLGFRCVRSSQRKRK